MPSRRRTHEPMNGPLVHDMPLPDRAIMAGLWKGWFPTALCLEDEASRFEWVHAGDDFQDAPFYHHAIEALLKSQPRHTRNRTSFEATHQVAAAVEALKPSGFIFHMSRCGSTLVSNALRCLEGTIVPAEPQPICSLLTPYSPGLWPGPRASWEAQRDALLRSMVHIFGQRRQAGDRRYFLKFTSWNSVQVDIIRRLWPDVPWLFVYRHPVEVMVSNLSRPPGWMRMAPDRVERLFGWKAEEVSGMSLEEYCARVLGRFCESVLASADAKAHLINYEDLDLEGLTAALGAFGVQPDRSERARIEKSMGTYSKDSKYKRPFRSDSELKRRGASAAVKQHARRWAWAPYTALNRHERRLR